MTISTTRLADFVCRVMKYDLPFLFGYQIVPKEQVNIMAAYSLDPSPRFQVTGK